MNRPYQIKGLGYFINLFENKILHICISFVKFSKENIEQMSRYLLNVLLKIIQNYNLSQISKYILIFHIFLMIAKFVNTIIKKNNKINQNKLSVKPALFFVQNKKNILNSEYVITSKQDTWEKVTEFIDNQNSKFSIKNDINNNKAFFKIIKVFLDYTEHKKNLIYKS
jgi:hypothetical protein